MKFYKRVLSVAMTAAMLAGAVSALADITEPQELTESKTINDNIIVSGYGVNAVVVTQTDNEVVVTVKGDVGSSGEGSTTIVSQEGATVKVTGDVYAEGDDSTTITAWGEDTEITVTGNVYNNGVASTTVEALIGGNVTVNGDVITGTGDVEVKTIDERKLYHIDPAVGISSYGDNSQVTVNGDVVAPGDGTQIVRAENGGIVTVNGNIEAGGTANNGAVGQFGTVTVNGDINITDCTASVGAVATVGTVTVNGDINVDGYGSGAVVTNGELVVNGDINTKGKVDESTGFGGYAVGLCNNWSEDSVACVKGEINVSDALAVYLQSDDALEYIGVYTYGITLGEGAGLIASSTVLDEDDEILKAEMITELEEELLENINYIIKYNKGVTLVDGYETNEDLGVDFTNKLMGNTVTVKVANGYHLGGDTSRIVNLGNGLYSMEALNGEKSFGYLLFEAIRDGLTKGMFVSVNGKQYIVADLDEDAGSITIVSMDVYSDEELSDLAALQEVLFTENQQDKVAEIVLPSDEILEKCCRYSEKFEHYGTEGRVQMTITSEYMCH